MNPGVRRAALSLESSQLTASSEKLYAVLPDSLLTVKEVNEEEEEEEKEGRKRARGGTLSAGI